VRYLAPISSDLKDDEIKKLKCEPIWSKENSVGSRRFVISDLYAPLALHREFNLPMLDWKGRWNRNTQEGIFFCYFIGYIFFNIFAY